MSTRGIKNNNPANIRRGYNWKGLVEKQTDKEFCQFVTMTWGIRALLVTLRTYVEKHHLHTVRKIITRWAPPSDGNNTEKYIEYVEKEIEKIDLPLTLTLQAIDFMPNSQHRECFLYIVARAICMMESSYYLDYSYYLNALYLM